MLNHRLLLSSVKMQSYFLYAAMQAERDSSLNNSPHLGGEKEKRGRGGGGRASEAEEEEHRESISTLQLSLSHSAAGSAEASEGWDSFSRLIHLLQ